MSDAPETPSSYSVSRSDLTCYELLEHRLSGPPVYTSQFFRELKVWIEKVELWTETGTVVPTFNSDGKEDMIIVDQSGRKKMFILPSYHQWIWPRDFRPMTDCDAAQKGLPLLHQTCDAPMPIGDINPRSCCLSGKNLAMYQSYETQWLRTENGNPRLLFQTFEYWAARMPRVDSILCFHLGNFEMVDGIPRSFLQFAAVLKIRKILQGRQSRNSSIPIYVYNPHYCAGCKDILHGYDGVRIVQNIASMFLRINEHSFVVSKDPGVAIRQIVADMAVHRGGPAGMLCNLIVDNGLIKDIMENLGASADENQRADPSSPRLLHYKEHKAREVIFQDRNTKISYDGREIPCTVFNQVGLYFKKVPGLE